MPLLALFSRKGQQDSLQHPSSTAKPPRLKAGRRQSIASRSDLTSNVDGEYVLPPIRAPDTNLYDMVANEASSSQTRVPLLQSNQRTMPTPLDISPSSHTGVRLVTTSPTSLSTVSSLATTSRADYHRTNTDPLHNHHLPPRRSSLFSAFDDFSDASHTNAMSSESLRSTRDSIVTTTPTSATTPTRTHPSPPDLPTTPSSKSVQLSRPKRPSLFSWMSGGEKSKSSDARSVRSAKSSKSAGGKSRSTLQSRRDPRSLDGNTPDFQIPPLPTSSFAVSPPVPSKDMTSKPTPGFQVTSRPRGGPSISDASASSSQMVTAGAFRQAARRSATNLPLPTGDPSTIPLPARRSTESLVPPVRPPLRASTPPSSFRDNSQERTDSPATTSHSQVPPRPPRGTPSPTTGSSRRNPRDTPGHADVRRARLPMQGKGVSNSPRHSGIPVASSSSEEEDEEEEEDSDDEHYLDRQTTITQRSAAVTRNEATKPTARSEIGHAPTSRISQKPISSAKTDSGHSAPPKSTPSAGLKSAVYARPRGALSTPSLPHSQGSRIEPTNVRKSSAKAADTDTSEDELSNNSSSEDDAPLAMIANKQRESKISLTSAVSAHSSTQLGQAGKIAKSKPLVDLNSQNWSTRVDKLKPTKVTNLDRNPSIRSVHSAEDLHDIKKANEKANLHSSSRRDHMQPSSLRQPSSVSPRPTSVSFSSKSRPQLSAASSNPSFSASSRSRSSSAFPPPRLLRESPASSSNGGDSSSGFLPLTPQDGSEIGVSRSEASKTRPSHKKRASVTFASSATDIGHSRGNTETTEETKRRERRRSEAKNAIELGNVVNGPGPLPDSDDEDMVMNFNGSMPTVPSVPHPEAAWNIWGSQAMSMQMMPTMPYALPSATSASDLSFLAAHQQAMMIAKHTYQMAVAQQAMAAAGEEWERSSNAGALPGTSSALAWGGGGMTMFPPTTPSVYSGSVLGGGWGASSVYGEGFGPAVPRQSMMLGGLPSAIPSSSSDIVGPRKTRQRTNTAPSTAAKTPSTLDNVAPPSSWKRR